MFVNAYCRFESEFLKKVVALLKPIFVEDIPLYCRTQNTKVFVVFDWIHIYFVIVVIYPIIYIYSWLQIITIILLTWFYTQPYHNSRNWIPESYWI